MAEKLAGSLEPISSGKGKWHEGVDAAGLGELQALAKDINKTIDSTVKHVARAKIKVGKLLIEARALFVDDQAFGKWRRENTLVQSKQHAHYLMQVAERFSDAPHLMDGVNYSVLQELVTAVPETIEWVEAKVKAGEPPTVVETREKVKADKPPPKGTSKKTAVVPPKNPTVSEQVQSLNSMVKLDLHQRIEAVDKNEVPDPEASYIIMGMDPDPQCPAHMDTIFAIKDYWFEYTDDKEIRDRVWKASEVVVNTAIDWR